MKNLSTTAMFLNDRLHNLNLMYTYTQDKLNSTAETLFDRDYLLDTLMNNDSVKRMFTNNLVSTMLKNSNVEVPYYIVRDIAENIINRGTITDNSYREYVQLHIDNYYDNDNDIILEPLFILDNHYKEFQDKVFSLHKEIEDIKRALEVL